MICIDSDVFLIDLRYPGDHRARTTRAFLETVAGSGSAAATVFNVLAVTGVLSFNLSYQQVVDFYAHFPRRYNVRVLPYHDPALQAFVTWNDVHFQGRLAVPTFTPATYPRPEGRRVRHRG